VKAKDDTARRDANIAVYRDQLKELEADLRNGIVSEEQYALLLLYLCSVCVSCASLWLKKRSVRYPEK
jgi:cytochrome c-type biogenesis protein CcmH/NrfG